MTADELQRIALRLSNSCWCRYWLVWPRDGGGPCLALHCVERHGDDWRMPPGLSREMDRLGFRAEYHTGIGWVWLAPRTNDDGTPYVYGVV